MLEKIYATLRANDSEVPGTPDIYFRMSSGLADVQTNEWELPDGTSFKFSPAERKVVLEAYKQRWDMLYNRLVTLWASCSIRYCIRSTSSTGLAW